MRVRFLGANQNVTGSQHFVERGDFRFVVDCGMVQEREFLGRNWNPSLEDPGLVNAILLTHAHLDHCGLLPRFVQGGFRGKIYATAATVELAKLILYDSAHIQEEDAHFKTKRHQKEGRKGAKPIVPLYTREDVSKVIPLFQAVRYDEPTKIGPKATATFHEAGHVLGSAFIEVELEGESSQRLLFSGDLGRAGRPILKDPKFFDKKPVDVLFIESTYGDRVSSPIDTVDTQLQEVINRTAKRGGKVIMPVFAVERAQEMLYRLYRLQEAGAISSELPIYLDSPMAVEATQIFRRHPECFDEETLQMSKHGVLMTNLSLYRTPEESKTLNNLRGPAVVMSSAGMCNAGRIKHHLYNHIQKKENTICFLGYQASGTLGRQIVEGMKSVRILGEDRKVRAEVVSIKGISGHADQQELLAWFKAIPGPPKTVFVVHGEKKSSTTLANLLRKTSPTSNVIVPEYGGNYIFS